MNTHEPHNGKPPRSGWAPMVCELYVSKLDISLKFWCGLLGFDIAYQRPEERFAYLERDNGAQVMLYQPVTSTAHTHAAQPDTTPNMMLQIFVEKLAPLTDALTEAGWPLASQPRDVWRSWGDRMGGKREIRLYDPDGHMLLIAEDIGERPL